MDIMESIRAGLKELILPEMDRMREDNRELKALIQLTNKRLDDVNIHMADQSRRIDEINKRIDSVRDELGSMIMDNTKRIDANNMRIDDINQRIDGLNQRIDETNNRIGEARTEILGMMLGMNNRIDQLKETMVRREETIDLDRRVYALEQHVETIHRRLAA